MNIGIDMMGGDFAPLEVVKGVKEYLSGHNIPATLFLIGDEAQVKELLEQHAISLEHIQIIPSEEVIGMQEHPTKALKEKKKSS